MGRFHRVLAITLMTAVLCADRCTAVTAPAIRPQVAAAASRLVAGLRAGLPQALPSARIYEVRREESPSGSSLPQIICDQVDARPHAWMSPLLLRLPPPLI